MENILQRIENVLDQDVRPALHTHGGDIRVQRFQDGVLIVKLLGQCSACPAAMETTESLVSATVTQAIPEIKEVVLDDSVDQGLLDFARKILSHNR